MQYMTNFSYARPDDNFLSFFWKNMRNMKRFRYNPEKDIIK